MTDQTEAVLQFVRGLNDLVCALPNRMWASDITIAASTYDYCVSFDPRVPGEAEPTRYLFDVEQDTIQQVPPKSTAGLCRMVDPPGLPCRNPAVVAGLCIHCLGYVLDCVPAALREKLLP